MPTPSGFPQVTKVLGKPQGWTDEQCTGLPVFTDGTFCVSKWDFSQFELEELSKTGTLWLTVHFGASQPPVRLDVLPPLHPEPSVTGKKLEMNGRTCPKCGDAAGIATSRHVWVTEYTGWDGATNAPQHVKPSTEISACRKCGYQVKVMNSVSETRERQVCQAIFEVTGVARGLNESMPGYQLRLLEQFGDKWPEMLDEIVQRVIQG